MEWMPISFLFLLRPIPVSCYCFTHVSPTPFRTLLSFSLKFNEEVWGSTAIFPQCSAKNDRQLQQSDGTKYT